MEWNHYPITQENFRQDQSVHVWMMNMNCLCVNICNEGDTYIRMHVCMYVCRLVKSTELTDRANLSEFHSISFPFQFDQSFLLESIQVPF
jgi:hypothetical protein